MALISPVDWIAEPTEVDQLGAVRWLTAEFMYRPRPDEPNARLVFDAALRARLSALDERDAVLFICNSEETAGSLAPVLDHFSYLRCRFALVNPTLASSALQTYTPFQCGWHQPERWQRMTHTDRWARLRFALQAGATLQGGWLVMPAHDAIYHRPLLDLLSSHSEKAAQKGARAAVSPYTPYQHSATSGVTVNAATYAAVIEAMNAGFARDRHFRRRIVQGNAQRFWGKMSLLPFELCAPVLNHADIGIWEDDKEIDRALRDGGWGQEGVWVSDWHLFRQSPPVFNWHDLKGVFMRYLHYSLNIPAPVSPSVLNQPLDHVLRRQRRQQPRYRRAIDRASALVNACNEAIAANLAHCGASWVDWGNYRYVARPSDADVEVWKRQ